ncbi:hypothetical protein BGX28_005654 [Mortierella sp. GBA30]|nr:hypothetical protein BGX28_005654 [Mortierella sp. GBA30]
MANQSCDSETLCRQESATRLAPFPFDASQRQSHKQQQRKEQQSNSHSPLFGQLSPTPVVGCSSSSPSFSAADGGSVTSPDGVESPEEIAIRRAEQNRAAQKAFRQRKQKYIKWLEGKAEELDEVYRIMTLIRAENQQLYNIVMELDGKLNETHTRQLSLSSSASPLMVGSSASMGFGINGDGPSGDGMGIDDDKLISLGHDAKAEGFGIDGGLLGREISMRLMNLATMPGGGSNANGSKQDANSEQLICQSERPFTTHGFGSGVQVTKGKGKGKGRGKGKGKGKGMMAFKMIQQTKQQGMLPHATLQPSQLLFNHQHQHHYHQHQHQQQQQLQQEQLSSPADISPCFRDQQSYD